MKHLHWTVLALLFCSAAAAAETAMVDAAGRAGERAASNAYYTGLAERLSQSTNPRHLLFAARLVHRVARDPILATGTGATTTAPSPEALFERAVELGSSDPWIWWMVATGCPVAESRCDRALARAKLRELAPSNAAVWMLRDPVAHVRADGTSDSNDEAGADQELEHIAAASRADFYYGETVRTHLDAYDQLPLPASFPPGEGLFDGPASLELVRGAIALTDASSAWLMRSFPSLPGCEQQALDRLGESRKSRCIAAARLLAREADTLLAAMYANGLLRRLLPDGTEREGVLRAGRALAWRQAAKVELQHRGTDYRIDPESFDEEIALWREPGATELGVMRRQLEAAGIPLEPPPDWTPSSPVEPLPASGAD